MTALPVDVTQQTRPTPVASYGSRRAVVDMSAWAARAGVILERLLTLAVLGLMVVAGVVIVAVTFGVMAGVIL